MNKESCKTRLVVALAGTLLVPVLHAQEAPAEQREDSVSALEAIVVTAQRRSQNVQDVPIAVSTANAAQLTRLNVTDVMDLRIAVPTLNLGNSNGFLSTSLRGLGSNAVNAGFENPVALYIDGVYAASAIANFLNFNNIAQIEVLKGPQGTLFGRNATAGLIQVSTRTPTQEFVSEGSLAYGNFNTVTGNLYVAGGLTPTLAADIALEDKHQGQGWGNNLVTGSSNSYRTDRDLAVRSKWVWRPADGTQLTFIGDYASQADTLNSLSALSGGVVGFTPLPGQPAFSRTPSMGYDVDTDTQGGKHGWSSGASVRLDQSIGGLNFMSLSAYRRSIYRNGFDYDGTAQPIANINYAQPDSQFTQEFQLKSSDVGRLTWVAGLYYFYGKTAYAPFHLNLFGDGALITINNHQKSESPAAYLQGTYELLADTKLTLGARYTYERRSAYDGSQDVFVIPLELAVPTQSFIDDRVSFHKVTYRASLDHRFSSELLGYLSYNTGFKSGGFNTGSPGTEPYLPETITAYEVGFKSDLWNKRIRLNPSAFLYNYRDVQSQRLEAGVIQIVNAAAAKIYGVDLDFEALLTSALRITGGFGAVSAKYTSYPSALLSNNDGLPSVIGSARGNYLPLAPKYTANFGVDYVMDGPFNGQLDLAANAYFNNGFFMEADNTIKQGSFAQIGVSGKWTDQTQRYWVSLYGKNLNNRQVLSFETTVANGTHLAQYAEPRTYGAAVGFKFH